MFDQKITKHNNYASLEPSSPWSVFSIAAIGFVLVSIDSTVLFAAFGSLMRAFPEESAGNLSRVLNAYTLVYAAFLIPSGGLADIYGRKRMFLLGVAIYVAAALACGMAPAVGWLITFRIVQAIGAAILLPASLSLILAAFPNEKRAVAVSLWGAVGGLSAAVGPALGAFVVDTFGWPWAFFINIPFGLIALLAGIFKLKESRTYQLNRKVDIIGILLVLVSIGGTALAVTEYRSPSLSREQWFVTVAAAVAAAALFVPWARFAANPLVDLSLFRNRTYSLVNLATLLFGVAFSMMFFSLFSFLTNVWQFDLSVAGLAVVPGPLMVVPAAILSGRFAQKFGHKLPLVVGCVLYALSGTLFAFMPTAEPAYWTTWLAPLMISGVAVGMVLPSLSGAAAAHLEANKFAIGGAINQAIRQIGSIFGVAIAVVVLAPHTLTRQNFQTLYLLHAALSITAGLLCFGVNTKPRAPIAQ